MNSNRILLGVSGMSFGAALVSVIMGFFAIYLAWGTADTLARNWNALNPSVKLSGEIVRQFLFAAGLMVRACFLIFPMAMYDNDKNYRRKL